MRTTFCFAGPRQLSALAAALGLLAGVPVFAAVPAAPTPIGHINLEFVRTGETFSLDIARANDNAAVPMAIMTGIWSQASSPKARGAQFSLELAESSIPMQWHPMGAAAVGIRDADGAVFILEASSPGADGSFSALLRDGTGHAIARIIASGDFSVDNGTGGTGSIVWLASILAITESDVRGGTVPCSPNYDNCKADAVNTCGDGYVASFKCSCNPQTGAVTCEWSCQAAR